MVATNFDAALAKVLKHEGGYVNHRADPGGPTNLGVTLATARRLGIDVDLDGDVDIQDIKLLKPKHAAKVYRSDYWNSVRADDLPSGVDYCVFDFAVNSGVSRAIKFLQRAVGVRADGTIGPITLDAVYEADPAELSRKICDNRLAWLRRLKTWKHFGKGWSRRVRGVREASVTMAALTPKRPPVMPPDVPTPIPVPPHVKPENAFAVFIRAILEALARLFGGRKNQ